jgi:hypothetical protein
MKPRKCGLCSIYGAYLLLRSQLTSNERENCQGGVFKIASLGVSSTMLPDVRSTSNNYYYYDTNLTLRHATLREDRCPPYLDHLMI